MHEVQFTGLKSGPSQTFEPTNSTCSQWRGARVKVTQMFPAHSIDTSFTWRLRRYAFVQPRMQGQTQLLQHNFLEPMFGDIRVHSWNSKGNGASHGLVFHVTRFLTSEVIFMKRRRPVVMKSFAFLWAFSYIRVSYTRSLFCVPKNYNREKKHHVIKTNEKGMRGVGWNQRINDYIVPGDSQEHLI